jgi:hypothetical protein
MRDLLFTLWIQAEKSADDTLKLIEDITTQQYEVLTQGGARIIRASVAGKSFDYQLPSDWSASDFTESLREAYKQIKKGGTDGAQMTDSELEDWVLDSNGEVTDSVQMRVALTNSGNRF